ncbi:putative sodium/metabolite cotransporter BASS1, chloroplastic [Tetrabaena socialis]|uniref:Putative sodium/metabolite cotransporter BASS1, chloroplastic n=1 Tax=Tetrabaena socialis TaxID=47790 RepID=A0A2J7ZPK3_9CHLO|nr:putative sodium/metabolite cotransporter BASS1, chloroplastic [Tetrabaena socialis]|eukprot:PNH02199.1 putative sodium/metabolite cotransporter BASS1, chloroplastic [Tetrabaena socialis]
MLCEDASRIVALDAGVRRPSYGNVAAVRHSAATAAATTAASASAVPCPSPSTPSLRAAAAATAASAAAAAAVREASAAAAATTVAQRSGLNRQQHAPRGRASAHAQRHVLRRYAGLPAPLAVGIVVLSACPGGTASNIVAYLARGEMALSILMTAASTLAAVVATPAITAALAGRLVAVDAGGLVVSTMQPRPPEPHKLRRKRQVVRGRRPPPLQGASQPGSSRRRRVSHSSATSPSSRSSSTSPSASTACGRFEGAGRRLAAPPHRVRRPSYGNVAAVRHSAATAAATTAASASAVPCPSPSTPSLRAAAAATAASAAAAAAVREASAAAAATTVAQRSGLNRQQHAPRGRASAHAQRHVLRRLAVNAGLLHTEGVAQRAAHGAPLRGGGSGGAAGGSGGVEHLLSGCASQGTEHTCLSMSSVDKVPRTAVSA